MGICTLLYDISVYSYTTFKLFIQTNHDATLFTGEGCFEKQTRHLVYSVISGDEKNLLVNAIKKVDPQAFVNIVNSKQILGKFYRKPND